MSSETHARESWAGDGCVTDASPFGDATASLHRMRDVVGRKWQPLVVYHLRKNDSMGFSDLKAAIEGISSKMLSESLDDLEATGIIEREIVSDRPVRVAYSLTDAGESLEEIICDLIRWEEEHLDEAPGENATENQSPVTGSEVAGGGSHSSGGDR
jgi:DNA-binding HxlR family transcriptional regulator